MMRGSPRQVRDDKDSQGDSAKAERPWVILWGAFDLTAEYLGTFSGRH